MIALPGSIDENKTKKNRRCGNSTKHGDDAGARVTCSDEKSHKAENGDPRMDVMGSKTKRFGTRGRAGVGWRGQSRSARIGRLQTGVDMAVSVFRMTRKRFGVYPYPLRHHAVRPNPIAMPLAWTP